MHLIDLINNKKTNKKCVITIGNFDGIHLGHKKLMNTLTEIATKINALAIVITFYPTTKNKPLILNLADKLFALRNLKIDKVGIIAFNKLIINMNQQEFIKCLSKYLPKIDTIILGKDFRFGKDRKYNVDDIIALKNSDFKVLLVDDVLDKNNKKISSSFLRLLLQKNDFSKIKEIIGEDFSLIGKVIKGKGLGQKLLFPTINLYINNLKIIKGVYLIKAYINEQCFYGVANYGQAPSVKNTENSILELHLFKFNINTSILIGSKIRVVFYSFIRGEKKFSSLQELKNQIKQDIIIAKNKLNTIKIN